MAKWILTSVFNETLLIMMVSVCVVGVCVRYKQHKVVKGARATFSCVPCFLVFKYLIGATVQTHALCTCVQAVKMSLSVKAFDSSVSVDAFNGLCVCVLV